MDAFIPAPSFSNSALLIECHFLEEGINRTLKSLAEPVAVRRQPLPGPGWIQIDHDLGCMPDQPFKHHRPVDRHDDPLLERAGLIRVDPRERRAILRPFQVSDRFSPTRKTAVSGISVTG